MNVSGILVVVPASEVDRSIETLAALPGVEVHHADSSTGRIAVTQEAERVDDEVDGLRRIKALPDVILAEMVYHYFEEDKEIIESAKPAPEEGGLAEVPPFLED